MKTHITLNLTYKQINQSKKHKYEIIQYSNKKLGYKENLTYKQLENLIKQASRKLDKTSKQKT